uniref:Ig-like domain-containing protein n=1 Tax=Sinocyclocheilus grahami TaxID=75366 RepID=A0A672QLZ5_SINGR
MFPHRINKTRSLKINIFSLLGAKMFTYCYCHSKCFHLLTDFSVNSSIIQTPTHLLSKNNKEANISCHHGDSSYLYLFWYQQKNEGGSLELIGMQTGDSGTPEEKFKPRFALSGHATKDAFLLISSISAEDSAVYFCATSKHSHIIPYNR